MYSIRTHPFGKAAGSTGVNGTGMRSLVGGGALTDGCMLAMATWGDGNSTQLEPAVLSVLSRYTKMIGVFDLV